MSAVTRMLKYLSSSQKAAGDQGVHSHQTEPVINPLTPWLISLYAGGESAISQI